MTGKPVRFETADVRMVGTPQTRDATKPVWFYAWRRAELFLALQQVGWSVVTFASRVGVSEKTARRWLSGHALVPEPELRWLQSVARAAQSVGDFPGRANDAG